jgi:hypothetical protein
MSTKAERFRYQAERSGPKRPKAAPRPKRKVTTATTSAGVEAALPRNTSKHAGRKAAYKLETSATKPSRKSTRRAANRIKTDSQMRVKSRLAEGNPPKR